MHLCRQGRCSRSCPAKSRWTSLIPILPQPPSSRCPRHRSNLCQVREVGFEYLGRFAASPSELEAFLHRARRFSQRTTGGDDPATAAARRPRVPDRGAAGIASMVGLAPCWRDGWSRQAYCGIPLPRAWALSKLSSASSSEASENGACGAPPAVERDPVTSASKLEPDFAVAAGAPRGRATRCVRADFGQVFEVRAGGVQAEQIPLLSPCRDRRRGALCRCCSASTSTKPRRRRGRRAWSGSPGCLEAESSRRAVDVSRWRCRAVGLGLKSSFAGCSTIASRKRPSRPSCPSTAIR